MFRNSIEIEALLTAEGGLPPASRIDRTQGAGHWPNDGADIAKTIAKTKGLNVFRSPQLLTLF